MSIEAKLEQKEAMIAKLDDRRVRIEDYLDSEKVKALFSRYLYSASEKSNLIERNDRFRLYLNRDALELYEYKTIEVNERLNSLPILRSIFVRRWNMKDLSYDPVFKLSFNEDGSHEIVRLVLSLTADELIEALDELLFEKGAN